MKYLCFLTAIGIVLFSEITAFTANSTIIDTSLANSYMLKATSLADKASYDSSMIYINRARDIFRDANFAEGIAKADNFKGEILILLGKLSEAQNVINEALGIVKSSLETNHPQLAESYNLLGVVDYYKGSYDGAIDYFRKSLNVTKFNLGDKHPDIATNYNNLGVLYMEAGYFEKALEFFLNALNIEIQHLGDTNLESTFQYDNIGRLYEFMGDYDNAQDYYNKSLMIKLETLVEIHPMIADSYFRIGRIYAEEGDYEKGLEYQQKSLNIRMQQFDASHLVISENYHALGLISFRMQQYKQALDYLEKSLELDLSHRGESHPNIALINKDIGNVHRYMGNTEKALQYYWKSEKLLLALGKKPDLSLARTYIQMGNLYRNQGRLDLALTNYHNSIRSYSSNFNDPDVLSNPTLIKSTADYPLLAALSLKAKILTDMGAEISGNKKMKFLIAALQTYDLAADLTVRIRQGYHQETSKLKLVEEKSTLFSDAVHTCQMLYQQTQDIKYLQKAFKFAEGNRARVLRENLSNLRAMRYGEVPDSLIEKTLSLNSFLTYYENQLLKEETKRKEANPVRIDLYSDKVFTLRRKLESLIEKYERDYPAYYQLKYHTDYIGLNKLQAVLDPETVILEYAVADSQLTIFIISTDDFVVRYVPVRRLFEEDLQSYTYSIKKIEPERFIRSSSVLYKDLIKPVEDLIRGKKKLIVIPEGVLLSIPFEALIKKRSEEKNLIQLPYLIKDYEISYHYSANLYFNSAIAKEQLIENKFVGFAPLFAGTYKNRLPDLPKSRKEVKNIVQLFRKNGYEAAGHFGIDAAEANFKQEVSGYSYIHVATHGLINEEKPQLSGLVFSQRDGSNAKDDGILYSGETYNLKLNADLVVLSSCESGKGKLIEGEGMMALARGFFYSGARNIVYSLWKVDDRSTSILMVETFKGIIEGKSYSSSLRSAKLKMIRSRETTFPKSWSGFVLLGE